MRTARTPKTRAHEAQLVAIDSLKPYPGNARTHDLEGIRESLRINTQYRPVVVRTKTRHVLAGNGTIEAAQAEGWTEIWATFIDCDAKAAKRINLVDNRLNDLAGWDERALAAQLGELPGVEGTGWSERELVSFVAKVNGPGLDTEPIEPPKEPRTKLGDLWVLGEHRLLCGDATSEKDHARLMDGEKAQLVATDPPYGVDYARVVGGRKNEKVGGWRDIAGDALDDDALYELIRATLSLSSARTLFLWHPDKRSPVFRRAVQDTGWEFGQEIIWVKNALIFGGSDYQYRHESCIYARRKGSRCDGDRTQTTVLEFPKEQAPPHPTQKPVAVFEIPVRRHTDAGESVYEPFAGSGTALIACENLNRRCYAMEIDPGYCDVIVDRWQRHTGKQATRG